MVVVITVLPVKVMVIVIITMVMVKGVKMMSTIMMVVIINHY